MHNFYQVLFRGKKHVFRWFSVLQKDDLTGETADQTADTSHPPWFDPRGLWASSVTSNIGVLAAVIPGTYGPALKVTV